LLVNAASGAAVRAAAMELAPRLAGEGFAIEVTGPWPTYSFCGEDDGSCARREESACPRDRGSPR